MFGKSAGSARFRWIGHYCLLTSSLVSSCIYADRAVVSPKVV